MYMFQKKNNGEKQGTLSQSGPRPHPDSLQKGNQAMKERFEGLAAWREKQQEDRSLLESNLEEAKSRLEAVTAENQELRSKLEELRGGGKVRFIIVLLLFILPLLFLMLRGRDVYSPYSKTSGPKRQQLISVKCSRDWRSSDMKAVSGLIVNVME